MAHFNSQNLVPWQHFTKQVKEKEGLGSPRQFLLRLIESSSHVLVAFQYFNEIFKFFDEHSKATSDATTAGSIHDE